METTVKGLGFSAQRGLGGLEGLRPVQVGCIFYRVYAVKGLGSAGFRVCRVYGFESKVWSPGGCKFTFWWVATTKIRKPYHLYEL